MNVVCRLLFALLAQLWPLAWLAHASAYQAPIPAWEKLADSHFTHFEQEHGLPHNIATAIAQDREGFLWIGTQGGLARWDGYHFRTYTANPNLPQALPDDMVQVLHLDRGGQLWIGTASGGLTRYHPEQDNFSTIGADKLGNPSIFAITDDNAGGIWIATDGGLNHLSVDGQTLRHWRHQAGQAGGLPDNRLQALLHAHDGSLWVGSRQGLVRMQGDQFVPIALPDIPAAAADIRALWQTEDGQIWIGTARQGAFVLNPSNGKVLSLSKQLPALKSALINTVTTLDQEHVWLGSFGRGLFVVNLRTHAVFQMQHQPSRPSSLADNAILALFRDNSKLVWVASQRGISRHDPNQAGILNLYGYPGQAEKIGDRDVWSVLQLKNGLIWLGLGSSGVDVLHPQHGVVARLRPNPAQPKQAMPEAIVLSMVEIGEHVYLGTNRGMFRAHSQTYQVEAMPLAPRKPGAGVSALHVANDKLWLAGSDGVWEIPLANGIRSDSKAKQAEFTNLLNDKRVVSLSSDTQQQLWIGSWNGLAIYDLRRQSLRNIPVEAERADGLGHGYITNFMCDRSGRVWIGTSGAGLHLWQGENAQGKPSFRRFGIAQGMPNQIINKILQDQTGYIWVSTDGGLARIASDKLKIHALRRADGVQFPTYWANAGILSQSGELLFGASGGLTILRPDKLTRWDYQPTLAITEIKVAGKPVNPSNFNLGKAAQEDLVLSANQNHLSVEFAALDFSAPEKNRYAYQLQGFDSNWVEVEANRRLISYTNLPPGKYQLRLRGSNRTGTWVAQELLLPISVLPAWHQTWWFRSLLVLGGLGLVGGLVQIRTSILSKQTQVLEQIVTRRTNELREQQQALLVANSELKNANQELAHSANTLRELGEIGRDITASLNLDSIFHSLHQHVRHLLDAPTLSLYRANLQQEQLEFVFGRVDEQALPANNIPFSKENSYVARTARERCEILVELEYGQANPNPIPGTRNMLTLLFGPLIVDQRLLGVMSIQSDHVRAYGERERMIFRTLCAYAAIALANGKAYTQLQEAQTMLVAQEKLAALGALVAGVAHELNTPLGNGLMMASALQDSIDHLLAQLQKQALPAEYLAEQLGCAQEATQILMRSLRNSAQLINSFKQVAVDRTSAQRRMFDLRQTSMEVLATLMNQIKSQGHDIEVEIPENIMLDSYPGSYGQVLAHLISNALLHGLEGRSHGKIQIRAQCLEAGRVQIQFSDNGKGIPAEDLKRIFDPFFTTKMGQGGKGLGLSVCYNIVTSLLNGQIKVCNQQRDGACFTLDLPLIAQW